MEFKLILNSLEAIEQNTTTLLYYYKKGEIFKKDILQLKQEAINDEQYELAISLKQVLDYISNEDTK